MLCKDCKHWVKGLEVVGSCQVLGVYKMSESEVVIDFDGGGGGENYDKWNDFESITVWADFGCVKHEPAEVGETAVRGDDGHEV